MPNLAGQNPAQLPANSFLGTAAYAAINEILASKGRQEINFFGTGSSVSYTIRRPYPFTLGIVNSTGSSTATLPTANADGTYTENTDYTLIHEAASGIILTVELTPVFPII